MKMEFARVTKSLNLSITLSEGSDLQELEQLINDALSYERMGFVASEAEWVITQMTTGLDDTIEMDIRITKV